VDIKRLLSKEKIKEGSYATVKGSLPAALITGLLSGASSYIGWDLNVDAIIFLFFGAGLGGIVGQFQKSPKEALLRFKGLFSSLKDG
tara:strand:- start:15 stop:275 length:261 start_codon:yes stop_codon:yes gene_type:complete